MKLYKFKGLFRNDEGNEHELEVHCGSYSQAFFLLTADAIRAGKHYKLYSITNENDKTALVKDIDITSILKY